MDELDKISTSVKYLTLSKDLKQDGNKRNFIYGMKNWIKFLPAYIKYTR